MRMKSSAACRTILDKQTSQAVMTTLNPCALWGSGDIGGPGKGRRAPSNGSSMRRAVGAPNPKRTKSARRPSRLRDRPRNCAGAVVSQPHPARHQTRFTAPGLQVCPTRSQTSASPKPAATLVMSPWTSRPRPTESKSPSLRKRPIQATAHPIPSTQSRRALDEGDKVLAGLGEHSQISRMRV